ncbi:MAG: hypothetical protein P8Y68_04230 [Anaerolineales bacterium]
MDALTYIVAMMAALVFGWIGYFLGNFFPVFGKAKKLKQTNQALGRKMVDVDTDPVKANVQKAIDWLLERDLEESSEQIENAEKTTPQAFSEDSNEVHEDSDRVNITPESGTIPRVVYVNELPPQIGEGALVLWHDKRRTKLVARVDNELVDLDPGLSTKQHAALSMLLVDLQERVGISATLREAIAEDTDKVIAEKDRKRLVPPKEEEVQRPSFNPIKSFVNYVQADIPKLNDAPESIPDQINEILQDLIKETPLENKGILMADWPNRGVVFIVGVDVYDDIHKIPDSDIRFAIRTAVKKWEESQEGE